MLFTSCEKNREQRVPNYRTHVKLNIFFAIPLLLMGAYGLFHPTKELLLTFTYSTLFMNPDLDLVHKIKLFSLRGFLTMPFRGYSLIFHHRGLSHSPLFGTLTRILYLLILAFLLLALIRYPLPSTESTLVFITHHKACFFAAIAGIFLADLIHIILDKTVSKQ